MSKLPCLHHDYYDSAANTSESPSVNMRHYSTTEFLKPKMLKQIAQLLGQNEVPEYFIIETNYQRADGFPCGKGGVERNTITLKAKIKDKENLLLLGTFSKLEEGWFGPEDIGLIEIKRGEYVQGPALGWEGVRDQWPKLRDELGLTEW
jgi:hypothetical protein